MMNVPSLTVLTFLSVSFWSSPTLSFISSPLLVHRSTTPSSSFFQGSTFVGRSNSRYALHLTADEILARAREKAGVPEPEAPPPMLFDDDLLSDMQESLLTMERRVKEGPGSLTVADVEDLNVKLQRIISEMKVNHDKKPARPPRQASTEDKGAVEPSAPAPIVSQETNLAVATQQPLQQSKKESTTTTHNEEEGPAFDGKGGMGQPRGTVNTYIIPGMHEMTVEEYRDALQKSVSDRQAMRKAGGIVGNKSSQDYLDGLK